MPQIGAGERAAGVAVAGGIERAVVLGKFAALDVELAERGVQRAVAGVARGQDAVEHVHARVDAFDDVQRRAHAHEIAGLFGRQYGSRMVQHLHHDVLAFAYGKPADGIALEVEIDELARGLRAQILEHAALHDAEQQVSRRPLGIGVTAAFGPAGGHGQRSGGVGVIRPGGHALVKHHHNVRIQVALDAHHLFRREQVLRAVEVGTEGDPFLLDGPQGGKAEDLKAAAVREDGLVPRVEAVQAAAPRHEFVAGPQVQVIGVAEDDFRAYGVEIVGSDGLHAANRADGHEDGRVYRAVGRLENAGTGRAVRGVYLKGSGCVHFTSLQAMKAVEKGYIRDVRDLQPYPVCEGKGERAL